MEKVNSFKELLKNGKTALFGQDKNGMHWGEIRDKNNSLLLATVRTTCFEIHKWIKEYEKDCEIPSCILDIENDIVSGSIKDYQNQTGDTALLDAPWLH